jgi:hypothetical protein
MKKTIILLAALLLNTYSYTEDQIRIKITKNEKGEMILNVSGHKSPVTLEVNGMSKQIEVNENDVNMEKEFQFSTFSSPDTASGASSTPTDSQYKAPPVLSNGVPYQATPI